MNTIVQGKSMMSKVYIHKPVDWLGEALPDEERVIFSRIKLQIFEFLSTDSLNTELMLKIIDEMNQSGISLYILKEVVELIRIKLLSNNSKKVYLTITLVDALVKNCGPKIHVVVGDEMFMTTFSKITRVWLRGFGSKSKMVANYGLDTIQAWGEGFESRRYLYPHIYGTYTKLRAKSYIKFPGIQYDQRRVPIFLGPITPHEKQIVADYLLENQQMEDIDLLYFSDSDDETDGDHHPNNHQLQLQQPQQQPQPQHEQQHQDPFFGQMMETDNIPAANSFSGNMWSNQQSTTNTQSWSTNEDLFWNSLETKQTDDVFSRPPLPPPPSFATEERNPTFVFDWSQFESPPQTNLPNVSAQTDNKTIKEEVDPFHFFDEVSTGVQSHDFFQPMNEQNDKEKVTGETLSKSSLNDQFMTLDPLKDNDFMVKHHQFSQARNQLIHELAKQIESRPALVGNHGNHGDGDCDSGKMKKMMKNSFEGLRDENNTHNSPNTINDWTDSHDIHHHSENRSAVKKSSAYYDPSSDSKNRVCYYGTQRVIRREG